VQEQTEGSSPTHEMEQAVVTLLQAMRDLRHQLQATTMAQAADLTSVINAGRDMVNVIRNVALASDTDRLVECADKFHEYIEHILEVSYILCAWEHSLSNYGMLLVIQEIMSFIATTSRRMRWAGLWHMWVRKEIM
jgi:hypothetical protein